MKTEVLPSLAIIDASIFIFRYYFSMPSRWFANNGRPTETVYGYAAWLAKYLIAEKPKHVVACFDESLTTCFRNEIYADYKSSRVLPDEDLAFQLLACKKITELMGISSYASDRFEADDLIGSFAHYCKKNNRPYTIFTRDKDLAQLLFHDEARMWDYPDGNLIRREDVVDRWGISADQVADYLAIVGDTSDDIPGVPGVGPKSAASLLDYFGSWKNIKKNLNEISLLKIRGAKQLALKIQHHVEQIELARKLTTIDVKATKVRWKDTERSASDRDNLINFAQDLGFSRPFFKLIDELETSFL